MNDIQTLANDLPDPVPAIIDGRPVTAGHGVDLPVIYPATGETVGHLRESDAVQVAAAVESSRAAFDHGAWPRMGVDERKDILYRIRDVLRAHADELGRLEVLNTGLTLHNLPRHVERMARNFEFFAEVISTVSGEAYTQHPQYLTWVTRDPKGVGAMISPWNAPLALSSMRIASCIAFGNTCVLKPSEYTPLSVYRLVELLHEAGLPPGVVNLVNGRGHVTGAALVSHPGVDMVGFTGGTDTGRRIMADAAARLKPTILELGGKSANVIFESADLDQALEGALLGIYSNNGQQCLAGSRILVQRSIADAFIERFVERTRRIRVGDPVDPATEVGPVCYEAHMRRVLSFVDIAREDGAELLVGGRQPAGLERGWYVAPTAVRAPDSSARICQEEIFGPFATFLVFDDLDDAIRQANDSRFGLVAYVWSRDMETVLKCSRRIRAGTIWVNTPMMRELRAPFGGMGESGVGRDGMRDSHLFFTEPKTTTVPLGALDLQGFGR